MPDRRRHQQDALAFLQRRFPARRWEVELPDGRGNETYFASGGGLACFVKLNAPIAVYEAVAAIGLAPPVIAAAVLDDGTSLIVQPRIDGRTPSRRDYRERLEQFAAAIRQAHHSTEVRRALPGTASERHRTAGLESLAGVRRRWERCRALVPAGPAAFVDESLDRLEEQADGWSSAGLVASHNDICNANWILAPDGRLYLVDLDAMALDDPARDIGATLWWYYPPELRRRFLEAAGYVGDAHFDAHFEARMRVRMAMHCLHIILPREGSFDRFASQDFDEALEDFRAAFAGRENPQGYGD